MAKVITVKFLENLKPTSRRREVPDGLIIGLYLQIFPSGKMSWCVRYRFAGRTRKLTIGPYPTIGLRDARDLASKALVDVADGRDPGEEKKAARKAGTIPAHHVDLVEKVAAQFLKRHVETLSPTNQREVKRIMSTRAKKDPEFPPIVRINGLKFVTEENAE